MAEPRDWATEAAEAMVRVIACSADTSVMTEYIAARLRLIKAQGHGEGLASASAALDDVFGSRASDPVPTTSPGVAS